jgi:hypothetical protein
MKRKFGSPRHSIDLHPGHSSTDPTTSGTAYGASPTGYIGRPDELSQSARFESNLAPVLVSLSRNTIDRSTSWKGL